MNATITRRRIARSPFATGPGPAWKWYYDVQGLPTVLRGFDLLSIARRKAKEYGATSVIESWKR